MFTAQLEKSREATDLANVRAAYAEQMAAYLTGNNVSSISDIVVPAKQTIAKWQNDGSNSNTTIAEGHSGAGITVPAKTDNYTVAIDTATGAVTVS